MFRIRFNPDLSDASAPLSRLDELLIDRAVRGLSSEESQELAKLLDAAGKADDVSFDRAAAALDMALHNDINVEVPPALLKQLQHDAQAYCAGVSSARDESIVGRIGAMPSRAFDAVMDHRAVRTPMVMTRRYTREWSGWIAAAAAVAFGVYMWSERSAADRKLSSDVYRATIGGESLDELAQKAEARLERYARSGAQLLRIPMGLAKPVASGNATVGEVTWNSAEGTGVLKVTNLEPAAKGTAYQLWVYDEARDQRYPVSAGTIQVQPGKTETLIPIDPSIKVSSAAAFTVTLEQAGGNVTATREKVVSIAVPQAGEGMAPPPIFDPSKE
jgi:hypothetical protein